MRIENLSSDNIYLFTGIFVPARGMLTVEPEMQVAVKESPLLADYITGGKLVLHDPAAEVAEKQSEAAKSKTDSSKTLSLALDTKKEDEAAQ